jgi:PKD repeat protein
LSLARSVAVTILLVFVSTLFLTPKALPTLNAANSTGEVCITTSTTATTCPASPPTIGPLTVGSTFDVGVFIQGSAPMGGFDIYVITSPGYLVPTGAALGSLIVIPFATVICINDSAQPGSDPCGVQTANGPGVVQVGTVEMSGSNECSGMTTCSGMAFTISYKVVAAIARTSISYPTGTGCSISSVATPANVCVQVADATGPSLSENIQGAIVTQNLTPSPLTAGFSYGPTMPLAGYGVTFVAVANGGTPPYGYGWTFGDSGTGSGVRINHTYSSAGSYTVTLSVNDSGLPALAVSSQQLITVASPPLPDFSITVNPSYVAFQVGGTGSFTATVSQQNGFTGTVSLSVTTSPSNGLIVSCYPTSLPGGYGSSTCSMNSSTVGRYTVIVNGTSGSMAHSASVSLSVSTTPPPLPGDQYTLSWEGFDWDGGHEETIYLNGNAVASLPLTNVGGNGGAWVSFSLDMTSFVVQGMNRLTFAHAGWDCGTSDNVRSLSVTSGSSVVYSNSSSLPLTCAQSLTYTFTIGTAPPPPPPPSLTLSESFDTANPIVGQTCSFNGLAGGGVSPYSFSWDFGDGTTGFGSSVSHIYAAPGNYPVTLTVKDSASPSNTLSVTGYQTVSAPSPPSTGTYILSWQGYDWDGAGEETITLNGQVIGSLPGLDTPSNGGAWAPFSLNVTSYVVKGVNTLTFAHANWDCGTSDDVRNLQLTSGTTVIYSNPSESPLSCTQTLTYTFTV